MAEGDNNNDGNNNGNNDGDNGGNGDSSGSSSNWIESIPEQLRDAPFFKAATSVDSVLADLTNAAGHMGNSIRIPGPDASDDARNDFYKKAMEKIPGLMPVPNADDKDAMNAIYGRLGKPDNPEGYKAPEVEGINWDDHNIGSLKARAHAAGMSQSQFQSFITDMATDNKSANELAEHKMTEDLTALKTEWGSAYDTRISTIKALMNGQANTPPEIMDALSNNALPSATVRWLYDMAESVNGDGAGAHNDTGNAGSALTPVEASARAAEVRQDPDYFNPASPRHKMLVKKHLDLMILANPESENETIKSLQA